MHDVAMNRPVATFHFSVLHQPPTSPLFPYTTLFRSHCGGCLLQGAARLVHGVDGGKHLVLVRLRVFVDRGEIGLCLDRKSTRLNSSHVEISYAVFCLKKKKTQLRAANAHNDTPLHRL